MQKFLLMIFGLLFLATASAQTAKVLNGTASFYAQKFDGKRTAFGTTFSNKGMTCACNQLKLGTWVKVTCLSTNKSVILQVTDRLAKNNHRVVDVTAAAAKELGFYNAGLSKVKVEVVEKKKDQSLQNQEISKDSSNNSIKDTIFTTQQDHL
jgi:rare lipoprotein A